MRHSDRRGTGHGRRAGAEGGSPRASLAIAWHVDVPAVAPSIAEPEALPLTVLHEDATLIVINKAPGMVVHPAPGRWQGTLVNALLHRWGPLPGHEASRPGIVHRLDRDTSGVMVIARTTTALEHLGRQFAARTVEKRYLAVVRGVVRDDALAIDAPIGRHTVERKKMSTRSRTSRARPSRACACSSGFAQCDAGRGGAGDGPHASDPRASRGARASVLGDAVYGKARAHEAAMIERHALHAATLTHRASRACERR